MPSAPLTLCELPYPDPLEAVFATLAVLPWSQFLDSSAQTSGQGRYSILATAPRRKIWQQQGQLWIVEGNNSPYASSTPLWQILRDSLADLSPSEAAYPEDLPFTGGALGYLAYDYALPEHGLKMPHASPWPEAAFGIYDVALVVDHLLRKAWLCAPTDQQDAARMEWEMRIQSSMHHTEQPAFHLRQAVTAQWSRAQYAAAFDKVKAYIEAGDCYQVNLAQPFTAHYSGSPWPLYERLRALNPAAFSAYLTFPWGSALSFSPERLLKVTQKQMQVRPIKGTRPRASLPTLDAQMAEALRNSPKDRAENVMIVDLLRNDLGQVAATGSVEVTQLCGLESNAQVHHLVSVVEARLQHGLDSLDALAACFPGGSITGAPKRRAMEIIHELEGSARNLYCGSIGYLDRQGGMDMNIAIRSMTATAGEIRFWAGGGIVADSVENAEYQETLDKVALFHRELAAWRGLA